MSGDVIKEVFEANNNNITVDGDDQQQQLQLGIFGQLTVLLNSDCLEHFLLNSDDEEDTGVLAATVSHAVEHALFHLANILFLVSYLAPSTR